MLYTLSQKGFLLSALRLCVLRVLISKCTQTDIFKYIEWRRHSI